MNMVEWKAIGEISNIIRGNRVTKSDLVEDGQYPVISGGVSPLGYREPHTITIAQYGSAGYVDLQKKHFWANDVCYSVYPKDGLLNMYLYYYLKNKQRDIYSLRTNAVPAHLPQKELARIQIPIPSLSEQTRIVEILDTFSSSIENLKQQISERRKQYEHYRDELLDLEGKEGVEMKTLGDVCEIKGEYGLSVPSKPFDGVRYIRITDITDSGTLNNDYVSADCGEVDKEPLKDGDILFARTGATVGKTLIYLKQYGDCLYAGYLIRYRIKHDIALPKYVFHFTHSNQYNLWVKSNLVEGAQPNINAQKYNSLAIPVPSLSEQSRIVSILDTFEASIANLEAQLKEREKQYEYYRNKLLTFPGKPE